MLKPSVEVKLRDGVLWAEFWDCLRLDPKAVGDLRTAYERHVKQGGRAVVVVDMAGVGFAGSAALTGFLTLRKLGARVVFFRVESTVREVFRVSNLEPLFQFAEDETAAERLVQGEGLSSDGDQAAQRPPVRGGSVPLRRVKRGEQD